MAPKREKLLVLQEKAEEASRIAVLRRKELTQEESGLEDLKDELRKAVEIMEKLIEEKNFTALLLERACHLHGMMRHFHNDLLPNVKHIFLNILYHYELYLQTRCAIGKKRGRPQQTLLLSLSQPYLLNACNLQLLSPMPLTWRGKKGKRTILITKGVNKE